MTSSSSPDVLAECPFCGGEAKQTGVRDGYVIYCVSCSAKAGPAYHGRDGWGGAASRAAEQWNRRASQGSSPKTAIPAPADGQVASQRAASIWSAARNLFVRHADAFVKASRYEEASAIADQAARELEALYTSPTDQSSDVSGLVAALELIELLLTDPVPGYSTRIATARAYISEALAQAKCDGGAG